MNVLTNRNLIERYLRKVANHIYKIAEANGTHSDCIIEPEDCGISMSRHLVVARFDLGKDMIERSVMVKLTNIIDPDVCLPAIPDAARQLYDYMTADDRCKYKEAMPLQEFAFEGKALEHSV